MGDMRKMIDLVEASGEAIRNAIGDAEIQVSRLTKSLDLIKQIQTILGHHQELNPLLDQLMLRMKQERLSQQRVMLALQNHLD